MCDYETCERHNDFPKFGPYGFVLAFGLVSLLMDTVYEGALAVQGSLLASFGASALVIGAVSGIGEATALAGRLATGPLADRTGRYWLCAIAGYAITALSVPAMGFAGSLAGVAALVIFERFGKSLRTPSRDAMLSHAASSVGVGKGFGLHELLDQIGAVAGPLAVAGLLSITKNDYRVALGVLAAPGALAILVLLMLKAKVPDPAQYEMGERRATPTSAAGETAHVSLPREFWVYACTCGLMLAGVATYGVIAYHMVLAGVADEALVPALYAIAMGVDAVFAVATGFVYDKIGPRTLLVLPLVCAAIPFFVYADSVSLAAIGVALWGVGIGIQESTMRAVVSDLVPSDKRASAFGIFSVFVGVGGLAGGVIAGALYGMGIPAIVAFTCVVETIALVALVRLF